MKQKGARPRTPGVIPDCCMMLTAQLPSLGYRGTGMVQKHNGWGNTPHCVYTSLYSSNYTPIHSETAVKSTPVQQCGPSPCLLHNSTCPVTWLPSYSPTGWAGVGGISQFDHFHKILCKIKPLGGGGVHI